MQKLAHDQIYIPYAALLRLFYTCSAYLHPWECKNIFYDPDYSVPSKILTVSDGVQREYKA